MIATMGVVLLARAASGAIGAVHARRRRWPGPRSPCSSSRRRSGTGLVGARCVRRVRRLRSRACSSRWCATRSAPSATSSPRRTSGVTASVLAPLLFLPLLAFRKLAPALPLTALYFVADVPLVGPDGGGRTVPLLAFAFVAATLRPGPARAGRSIERVLVDRGLLALLIGAGVAALLTTSALAPYAEAVAPRRPGRGRPARGRSPPSRRWSSVRVPEALAAELAERTRLRGPRPGRVRPRTPHRRRRRPRARRGRRSRDLDDHERFLLRRRIEDRGLRAPRAGRRHRRVRAPHAGSTERRPARQGRAAAARRRRRARRRRPGRALAKFRSPSGRSG